MTPEGDVLSTIFEEAGGAIPLTRCSLDGSDRVALFGGEAGIPWGAAVAREAGWLVVASLAFREMWGISLPRAAAFLVLAALVFVIAVALVSFTATL